MTLTTHILVAGAAAEIILAPLGASGAKWGPLAAFFLGWASHYFLDLVPHWSYRMPSVEKTDSAGRQIFSDDKKQVVKDVSKAAADLILGTIVLFLLTKPEFTFDSIIFWLAVVSGSVLPDALQGVDLVYKGFPFAQLKKFGGLLHFDKKGEPHDLAPTILSVGSQVLIVGAAILILTY